MRFVISVELKSERTVRREEKLKDNLTNSSIGCFVHSFKIE